MGKLEYDSLHKFLVSLGLIFIALPFAVLFFFVRNDPVLISQAEFDLLSQYSQTLLCTQECLYKVFIYIIPWFCGILFAAGIILLISGVNGWKKVQNNLDASIEFDLLKSELEIEKMKNSEIYDKAIIETKEAENIETQPEQSAIKKYMDLEERFFSTALPKYVKKRYSIHRDIKIGSYYYDGVAISSFDNIDLIYEIKYWRSLVDQNKLFSAIEQVHNAGVNYETMKYRNFRCILVIITPEKNIEKMKNWVENELISNPHYDKYKNGFISIRYLAEEKLR